MDGAPPRCTGQRRHGATGLSYLRAGVDDPDGGRFATGYCPGFGLGGLLRSPADQSARFQGARPVIDPRRVNRCEAAGAGMLGALGTRTGQAAFPKGVPGRRPTRLGTALTGKHAQRTYGENGVRAVVDTIGGWGRGRCHRKE